MRSWQNIMLKIILQVLLGEDCMHITRFLNDTTQLIEDALKISLSFKLPISGYSIDSRTIKAGEVFFAIKGENHDGNKFAFSALEKGAVLAIVDEDVDSDDPRIVKIEDAYEALVKFAKHKRSLFEGKVIGVTGSVGKTTTKELLKAAIESQEDVYASSGNFNNHWGLPLSLANLPLSFSFAVFELGMNHENELSYLSKILEPDIAIITTVEAVHLEFFSSVSAIAKAKSEIFDGMREGGLAILNLDNPYFQIMYDAATLKKLKVCTFGENEKANYCLSNYQLLEGQAKVGVLINQVRKLDYTLKITGKHIALNSVAVIAACDAIKLDLDHLSKFGFIDFYPQKGRGFRYNTDAGYTIVDEAYNASPAAVEAAIRNLGQQKGNSRFVLLLGDMRELGARAEELHVGLVDVIKQAKVDKVFLFGEMMGKLYNELPESLRGGHSNSKPDLLSSIKNYLKKGDYLLVKGSASMKMQEFIDVLK